LKTFFWAQQKLGAAPPPNEPCVYGSGEYTLFCKSFGHFVTFVRKTRLHVIRVRPRRCGIGLSWSEECCAKVPSERVSVRDDW